MNPANKRIVMGVIFLATLNLVANAVVILGVGDDYFRMVFTDLTFPIGGLFATVMLIYAAWKWRGVSSRRFYAWLFLALSYLVMTLADVVWAVLEVGFEQTPYPSLADWFYVAYYPLFLLGIILFPARPQSRLQLIKSVLDAGIVLIAASIATVIFIIAPVIVADEGAPWIDILLSVLYPAGDILILLALLRLIYWRREGKRDIAMWLLAASGAFTIYIDCIFSLQTLADTYISGGILDIGWLFANYLILLAGVWEVLKASGTEKVEHIPIGTDRQARWVTYLPYLWIVVAYWMLDYDRAHQLPVGDEAIIYWLGLLIVLALVRQLVMIEENIRLTNGLQEALERGKRQEAALEKSNRSLESEIEMRKNIEAQLQHAAYHDPLTGLPNRVLFMDHLMHSFEHAKRHPNYAFSVLFMDLDNFKVINDTLGHSFGDKLLTSLARKLEACIRSNDMISRFGGDEFTFLIEDGVGPNSVIAAANRIMKIVSTPFTVDGKEVRLSASMGIVRNERTYLEAEELLKDADFAMYRAKAYGKGKYEVFHTEMRIYPGQPS